MEDEIEEMEPRPPSVRQTFTLRNNAARQVAVNFMPSRQLPYNTLRLRRTNSEHNALLEEASEVADMPDSSEKQADLIVREMEQHQQLMEDNPEAEEMRREALRDLPQCLTMKRNVRAKLSASVSLRSKKRPISMWKQLKYRHSFMWKRLRENLRNVVFSFEFWYESIRKIEGHFGSAVGSYFYFLRWLFVLDVVLSLFVVAFIIVPQVLFHAGKERKPIGFMDFFTGTGGLEDSLLFYGHYHHGDISSGSTLTYNMPFAYFFTMVCLYFLFFGILCYRTAYSYRANFIETSGGVGHVFANKLFCGWDFGIVTQQAAVLNANSLFNEFKELLSEQNKRPSRSPWTVQAWRGLVNSAVTLLVLGCLCGGGLALWALLAWRPRLLAPLATAARTLCPLMFHLIVKLEYYRPRTALYVTLARTWLLDIGTLMVMLVFWSRSTNTCWETSFGQEAYRLVLLDTVVSLIVLPGLEFTRAFVHKCSPGSKAPQFNIAYNSLTLLYNQAVLWLGLVFAPPLAPLVALKLLVLFYVKRECALRACQPAKKVWRAAQTQTVLYMFVTLSLFFTLFGIGTLFFRSASQACGPLQSYQCVYSVFSEGVLRLSARGALRHALAFCVRPGVLAFLMLALGVAVYYMRAKALAQRSMADILRHMLLLQAKDKDFLLTAIAKVSNGEWQYSPKCSPVGADSHTWRYVREVRRPSNCGFHLDAARPPADRPRAHPHHHRASRANTDDGDTDSSFSWQGSTNCLNRDVAK